MANDNETLPLSSFEAAMVERIDALEHEVEQLQLFVYDPWETGQSVVDAVDDINWKLDNEGSDESVDDDDDSTDCDDEDIDPLSI